MTFHHFADKLVEAIIRTVFVCAGVVLIPAFFWGAVWTLHAIMNVLPWPAGICR